MAGPPFELDGFEPVRRLGGGGFGDVWLARQTNVDRQVAVKVGHAPIDDRHVQMRFERECKALGRLSGHPNIIEVFTAGQLRDGRPYLVLEYVSGGTLWQRVQKGPVSEGELCRIAIQLSAALDLAHTTGVLHRDLKPENVLLRPNGEAVLGDFGIARLHDGANTTSHAITASVAYAAPEILSGQAASVASDIYGIGVCLLAAVIRRVPFVHDTDQTIHPIINRVLTDTPPDLGGYGFSAGFVTLLGELLAKNPAHRPSSAAEVGRRLEAVLRGGGQAPPRTPTQAREPAGETRAVDSFVPNPTPGVPDRQISPFAPPDRSGDHAPQVAGDGRHRQAPAQQAPPSTGGPRQFPGGSAPPTYSPQPAHSPGPVYSPQPAYDAGPAYSPGPTHSPGSGPGSGGASRGMVFAAAFGGTVLIGGLVLLIALGLTDRGTRAGDDTTTTGEELAGTATVTVPEETTTAPVVRGELVLPITLLDLEYGEGSTTEADFLGPATPQFCENIPDTTGLEDWKGETITGGAGIPVLFQEVIRFSTVDEAAAFLDAYTGTVDCEEFTVPANEGGVDVVFRPVVDAAPAPLGDATRAIDFTGAAEGVSVYARLELIQGGTDVYMVSLTALNPSDIDDLDGLMETAASRLGY